MKITKKQLNRLVEQVVADHLKTGPTVKLKKVVSDLEEIGKKVGVQHLSICLTKPSNKSCKLSLNFRKKLKI